MNILLIGSGGREAALKWALENSVFVKSVRHERDFLSEAECVWCGSPMIGGMGILKYMANNKNIDFIVIGPENPLVAGAKEIFQKEGKSFFGPSRRAAELEGSKVAFKLFCKAYDIPTADFDIATTPEQAKYIVQKRGAPIVIKADGLAGGKGVKVASTTKEAYEAIDDFSKLPAGSRLVIEDICSGWECSYIVFTDGTYFVPLPPVQDYKTTQAGSKINTGGMGCKTLSPDEFTPALEQKIQETILKPMLQALRNEGRPFTGAFYLGLMINSEQPYVLEVNCRLGDPETQTILPLLRDNADLFPYLHATTNGTMQFRTSPWKQQHSICVVLAAEGYPNQLHTGDVITGIEEARNQEGVHVFEAATYHLPDGTILTQGGRVLNVVATAPSREQARNQAYSALSKIHFKGMWYREDIGL